MWTRVLTMSLILFFVYLGDAILSDWVPAYMQTVLGGSLLMGLVMSFSSMVGFVTDILSPQLLKGAKTRRLILMAIGANLIFAGILLWTTSWPWLILFLVGMAIWGVYYELLRFGSAQYVSDFIPVASRSGVWAILGVFKSLAYFAGPIIGSWLAISRGNMEVVVTAASLVCVGYIIWALTGKKEKSVEIDNQTIETINIVEELKRWKTLFSHVWQILLVSLTIGIVDATYWTTGTVLSDNLAKSHFAGGLFLPLYMLPPVFLGIILVKLGVYKGKKKIAELFALLAGVFLILLGISRSVEIMLILSLLVGVCLAVAWPMTDAVYSDILVRMGKERKHMIGLSSSTVSLAHILGPVIAGLVASFVGEKMTFSLVGMLVVMVSVLLLFTTPKKLRLPQSEIAEWETNI